MKMRTYWLFLPLLILAVACSKTDAPGTTDDQGDDGNDDGNGDPVSVVNYFPLNPDSWWTYDNTSDQGPTRDSLYVAGTTVIDGETFTNMDAMDPPVAFMTNLFSQSASWTTDTQLIINGVLTSPPIDGFPDVTIPLENAILYDTTANTDAVLFTTSGSINEVVNLVPVVIDYTVTTVQGDTGVSLTLEGQAYDDVATSQIIVNIAVTAQIEIGGVIIPVPVLVAQDVLVVTNYYAKDTGLVLSETMFEYMLEDLSGIGIDLGIPNEGMSASTQTIDSFFIGN